MARPQTLKDRMRRRHNSISSSVFAAIGTLLIVASTSLSAFHSHEVETHDVVASAVESVSSADSERASVPIPAPAPAGSSKSDWLECGMCQLGHRGSAGVAVLAEALRPLTADSGAMRVHHEAPDRAKAVVLTCAGPRAPPLFFA